MKKILSISLSMIMLLTVLASVPIAGALVKELGEDMVEWTEENEFLYDGEVHSRLVQVMDGTQLLKEGEDYQINYYIYNGEEFEAIEIVPYEIGEYSVLITGIGAYQGEAENEFSIVADTSDWGVPQENAGLLNYVDAVGKTSAEVRKNESVWLKEESAGSSAWYGIDDQSAQQFRRGSRFWVRWLSPEDDKDAFEKYYNQLDEGHKKDIENGKLWIFLTGVTDPDGNEYTNLDQSISFYVQLGEDWNKDDIGAVFIGDDADETLSTTDLENFTCPEGKKEFAKIKLEHFSAYAIFEKSDSQEPAAVAEDTEPAAQNSPATGDGMSAALFASILAAGIGAMVLSLKKKEK